MCVSSIFLTEVVCVFVCVMSVLFLQVLLRCFLEPSHTCFLTSIVCSRQHGPRDAAAVRGLPASRPRGRGDGPPGGGLVASLHSGVESLPVVERPLLPATQGPEPQRETGSRLAALPGL